MTTSPARAPRAARRGRRVLPAALLLAACGSPAGFQVSERYADVSSPDADGMGRFQGATLSAAVPVETREVAVHGDRRPSLVIEAPTRLALRAAADAARLRFGLAVRPPDAALRVVVRSDGEVLHEETWMEERDWVERSVELGPPGERPREIEVELHGDGVRVMVGHPHTEAPTRDGAARRPHVILYVVDCLRADHVGAYGYPRPTTPHLDALAADGVLIEDLNACAPWTKPSTACLFTSLRPTSHRARTVDDALPHEHVTLAERLQREGYRTLAWVANPVIEPELFRFNQGFDRWVDLRSYGERSDAAHINALEPDAADITEAVLPWLEAQGDARFFLYLHSLDLHYEYRAREPFAARLVSPDSAGLDRDRELYDTELAYNDRELGRLVAALQRLDLYDETLLIVTSDHGEEFGEHGSARHGKTLYQQLLHIPGIVKLPGSRRAGSRVGGVASNVDLAPTILDLVGAEPIEAGQGWTLRPALESGDAIPKRTVYAEVVAPQVVAYAAREGRYKYVKQLAPALEEWLFDLRRDPGETIDLSARPPGEARPLFAALDSFLMRGQHGYHLSALLPGEGARTKIRLETAGVVAEAFRFGIETGDVLEVSDDRRRVTLEFAAGPPRRHLVLQTTPPGAPLVVALSSGGAALPHRTLRLGSAGDPASGAKVAAESARVSPGEADRLLADEEPGVRLWHVPFEAGGNPVELDDEALQTLRALGYIQ